MVVRSCTVIAKDDVKESSGALEYMSVNEEAANRAGGESNRKTEKRVLLMKHVALTVDSSVCSSMWTSSLSAKIFKSYQMGDVKTKMTSSSA